MDEPTFKIKKVDDVVVDIIHFHGYGWCWSHHGFVSDVYQSEKQAIDEFRYWLRKRKGKPVR